MRTIFLLWISLSTNVLLGQDNSRLWCFGDSAGIDFSDLSMPVPIVSYMDCPRSSASVGDSAHGLLMYANESYWPLWINGIVKNTVIHNSQNNIMQNGDTLIGDFFDALTFIPKPGNDSIYYLFQYGFNPVDGLYYSVIEPYYNNGQGRVTEKNIQLNLANSELEFGVYSIRHANGRDWWLLTRNGDHSNNFNLFLLTKDSLLGPFTQAIGTVTTTNGGFLAISKQGDKIALTNTFGLIETYSFDRCSGTITNVNTILINAAPQFAGCEFSPNGNLLYVSNTNNIFNGDSLLIYQFDLTSPQPASTRQVIYHQPVPASGGNLRRGPDDKIYLSCLYEFGWPYADSVRNVYNENLSVINSPDSLGAACNFTPFSFYLGGKRTYWGLPNNPNYSLGAVTGSLCDSLFLNIGKTECKKEWIANPNPCNNQLFINNQNYKFKEVELFTSDYRLVYKGQLQDEISIIDVSFFGEGIYFLRSGNHTEKIVILR